ncbi:MAG: serine hydrolase [Puia sp.]|nr:serine hydrolase [Puia sp.]
MNIQKSVFQKIKNTRTNKDRFPNYRSGATTNCIGVRFLAMAFCITIGMAARAQTKPALQPKRQPTTRPEQRLLELTGQYGIPGMQLVCIRDGKEESFNLGTIGGGSDRRVTANTIFEAASLSKCVFAYTVLRLYDKGILRLDTPLVHYTGAYEQFDPADPRYAKITARMVLRHTTGLPNWGDDKGAKLIFTPDSTFSYSGEGFQYLQRAVEKLTGKSLNELAQQEVFTPLGMTRSSYTWTDQFDTLSAFGNSPDAVNGHRRQMAAASLLSCAHDYAIFLRALMAGTGLKPGTHRMMFEKQSKGYWFGHKDKEANKHIWWGLGMGLQENETGEWVWQWGDNGDFKGFCIANPAKKEALVYFTHSNWGLHITTDILNTFFPPQTWWADIWAGYQFEERDHMSAFWTRLEKQGYDHVSEIARDLKQQDSSFYLPEGDVNDLAFILLRKGRMKEAIDVFKYNLAANPNSANAYDGLAEGYDAIGEKQLAIENYKKSAGLNPRNSYAADRIKKLEEPNK